MKRLLIGDGITMLLSTEGCAKHHRQRQGWDGDGNGRKAVERLGDRL
jgi:hypothetical protein